MVYFNDDEAYQANEEQLIEQACLLFSSSKIFAQLPALLKEHYEDVLDVFIRFTYSYLGVRPEELTKDDLAEVLFDYFPKKLSLSKDTLLKHLHIIKAFMLFLKFARFNRDGHKLALFITEHKQAILQEFENDAGQMPANAFDSSTREETLTMNTAQTTKGTVRYHANLPADSAKKAAYQSNDRARTNNPVSILAFSLQKLILFITGIAAFTIDLLLIYPINFLFYSIFKEIYKRPLFYWLLKKKYQLPSNEDEEKGALMGNQRMVDYLI